MTSTTASAIAAEEFLPDWGISSTCRGHAGPGGSSRPRCARRPGSSGWRRPPIRSCKVTDVAHRGRARRRRGALTLVDSTFATPALQRPIELGADVVLHSTTKYFGGHSDVQGGALVFARTGRAATRRPSTSGMSWGRWPRPSIPGWSCAACARWPAAMAAQRQRAGRGAGPGRSPARAAVHYPGLATHPGHAVAAAPDVRLRRHALVPGRGGREAALAAVVLRAKALRARDLAGRRGEPDRAPRDERGPRVHDPAGPRALSVGLEHPDDLMEDLRQALD